MTLLDPDSVDGSISALWFYEPAWASIAVVDMIRLKLILIEPRLTYVACIHKSLRLRTMQTTSWHKRQLAQGLFGYVHWYRFLLMIL